MKTATCACGHVGKSSSPSGYQCGACYYDARANSNATLAKKLRDRATKLDAEAATFRTKSQDFARKHPGAGPKSPPID